MLPSRISTREVAKLLGISRSRVRKLVQEKKLSSFRDHPQLVTFDLKEVEAFKSRYVKADTGPKRESVTRAGMMAARCFECFDQKMPITQIVQKLNLSPREIRDLYKEYITPVDQEPDTSELRKERLVSEREKKQLEISERKARIWERKVAADQQARQLRALSGGKVG